jgi:molecular chaperone DnaK
MKDESQAKDIDRVLLVGGSTRMPAVTELIKGTGKDQYRTSNQMKPLQ